MYASTRRASQHTCFISFPVSHRFSLWARRCWLLGETHTSLATEDAGDYAPAIHLTNCQVSGSHSGRWWKKSVDCPIRNKTGSAAQIYSPGKIFRMVTNKLAYVCFDALYPPAARQKEKGYYREIWMSAVCRKSNKEKASRRYLLAVGFATEIWNAGSIIFAGVRRTRGHSWNRKEHILMNKPNNSAHSAAR